MHGQACTWRSKAAWESVVSFLHMGSGEQTQLLTLGGKCLYTQNHLSSLI